jgi:hypothetical protein
LRVIEQIDGSDMLARINAIAITKEEMWAVAAACEEWDRDHPGDHGFEVGIAMIASVVRKGEHGKAFALWSRMNALANLISGEGAPGWTWRPKDGDGRVVTAAPMFTAAAVEPLLLDGNPMTTPSPRPKGMFEGSGDQWLRKDEQEISSPRESVWRCRPSAHSGRSSRSLRRRSSRNNGSIASKTSSNS